jgi:subtilisin family serine protease
VNPHLVRRRFEVHAAGSLDDVEQAVRKAVADLAPEAREDVTALRIEKFETAGTASVWVEATAEVAANVRDRVAGAWGVSRDWIEVPEPDARDPQRRPYPDRRSLARIDPGGLSRRAAGPRAAGDRGATRRDPVVVAVVDSGITADHPDFKGHLWAERVGSRTVHGARFLDGRRVDDDVTDQDGHGTMLAGTILATANFVDAIKIMALKFFDVTLQPQASNAAAAIRFAVEKKASIVNLSFDLGIGSVELEQAIHEACRAGVLVVMAAGNTGANNDDYPLVPAYYARKKGSDPDQGNREEAIVVMATDWYDERPTFSNFGPKTVDLAAPGVGVFSTRASLGGVASGGEHGRYTGTSPAAAQVTGAAALLRCKYGLSAADIKTRLADTGDHLPRLKCRGGRRLRL